MTVKELIETLKRRDPKAEVKVQSMAVPLTAITEVEIAPNGDVVLDLEY